MSATRGGGVIIAGGSQEKMTVVRAVVDSYGFDASGVFSEEAALQAIAERDDLLAVVAGGFLDEPAQERLRAAASRKGAVLITANIGHDDPAAHFTRHVVPKLLEARDRGIGSAEH